MSIDLPVIDSAMPTETGAVVRATFRGHQGVHQYVRTCDGYWKGADLGDLKYDDSDIDVVEVLWPLDSKAVPGWTDAAITADYEWHRFANASTPIDAASHLMALNDAMSDLRSWLPGYDSDTGTMPFERDDDEEGLR